MTDTTGPRDYPLGHGREEIDRLIRQARYLAEQTEYFLRLAGLVPGMRVLEVGCGAGDVTLITAAIIGPNGHVTAVDQSPQSTELAHSRVMADGITNVRFATADAAAFETTETYDAVIGRLVMLYWPDPPAVLRHLLTFVAPGGIVTFQDYDLEGSKSEPRCPLFELSLERMREALARAGAQQRMGLRMGRVFEEAGLPTPKMQLSARVERGPDADAPRQIADVTRTLLPVIERTGIATAGEIDVDTLARRLSDEAVSLNATLVAPPIVAAWTRKPS